MPTHGHQMLHMVICDDLQNGICLCKGDNPNGTTSAAPLQRLWQTGISLTAADSSLHEEQHLHSKVVRFANAEGRTVRYVVALSA